MSLPRTLWGLAGPSGCGKSTLALGLKHHYGAELTVLHLDDYFHKKANVPLLEGYPNFDCPEALRWDDFLRDVETLKSGQPVTVRTRSPIYNPSYNATGEKMTVTIPPAPILLLEGYLLLHHPGVRAQLHTSLFLNLDAATRHARRLARDPDYLGSDYFTKVLEPMSQLHLMPTAAHASHILPTVSLSPPQVLTRALNLLAPAQSAAA